jgi:hypothetical protein
MKVYDWRNRRIIENTNRVRVEDYQVDDRESSVWYIELEGGRYPEYGFFINDRIRQYAFIVEGHGTFRIHTQKGEFRLSEGDVIFLEKGDAFCWQGHMKIAMFSMPEGYLHNFKVVPSPNDRV